MRTCHSATVHRQIARDKTQMMIDRSSEVPHVSPRAHARTTCKAHRMLSSLQSSVTDDRPGEWPLGHLVLGQRLQCRHANQFHTVLAYIQTPDLLPRPARAPHRLQRQGGVTRGPQTRAPESGRARGGGGHPSVARCAMWTHAPPITTRRKRGTPAQGPAACAPTPVGRARAASACTVHREMRLRLVLRRLLRATSAPPPARSRGLQTGEGDAHYYARPAPTPPPGAEMRAVGCGL